MSKIVKEILNLINELGFEDIEEGDEVFNSVEEAYNGVDLDNIDEVAPKWVIRILKGKRIKKKKCPPGYSLKGASCVKIPSSKLRQMSIKAKRRMMKMKGKMSQILAKRKKSMRIRKAANL